jgi:hypothetical protein
MLSQSCLVPGTVHGRQPAYVLAGSAEEIETRYPELRVATERPFWLDHPIETSPGRRTLDEILSSKRIRCD